MLEFTQPFKGGEVTDHSIRKTVVLIRMSKESRECKGFTISKRYQNLERVIIIQRL